MTALSLTGSQMPNGCCPYLVMNAPYQRESLLIQLFPLSAKPAVLHSVLNLTHFNPPCQLSELFKPITSSHSKEGGRGGHFCYYKVCLPQTLWLVHSIPKCNPHVACTIFLSQVVSIFD